MDIEKRLSLEMINNLNEKSFHTIYHTFFRVLVSYASQITGEDEQARDIVQDVFSTLWERKQTFITVASFKTYLYNSVRNAALDQLRHRQVKENYMNKVMTDNPEYTQSENGESDTFNKEEIYRQLMTAIDELPEGCRKVFLEIMKGKKNEEIATSLNISIETVKTHKKRGMAVLRKKLNKQEYLILLIHII